jgi:hypothetical protein
MSYLPFIIQSQNANAQFFMQAAIKRKKENDNAVTEGQQQKGDAAQLQGIAISRTPERPILGNRKSHGRKR